MEVEQCAPLGAPTTDQEYEVVKTMSLYRSLIMDFLELKFKEREDWKQIRAQMLKLLGNSGLERRLRMIVTDDGGMQGGNR